MEDINLSLEFAWVHNGGILKYPLKYLERNGHKVYVVNPRTVKGMFGKKTYTSDAAWLTSKVNEGGFKAAYITADKWR